MNPFASSSHRNTEATPYLSTCNTVYRGRTVLQSSSASGSELTQTYAFKTLRPGEHGSPYPPYSPSRLHIGRHEERGMDGRAGCIEKETERARQDVAQWTKGHEPSSRLHYAARSSIHWFLAWAGVSTQSRTLRLFALQLELSIEDLNDPTRLVAANYRWLEGFLACQQKEGAAIRSPLPVAAPARAPAKSNSAAGSVGRPRNVGSRTEVVEGLRKPVLKARGGEMGAEAQVEESVSGTSTSTTDEVRRRYSAI